MSSRDPVTWLHLLFRPRMPTAGPVPFVTPWRFREARPARLEETSGASINHVDCGLSGIACDLDPRALLQLQLQVF